MSLVHARSLSLTVNAVEDAVRSGKPLSSADRLQAARWIARRRGLEGSYAGLPAITGLDRRDGGQVFTGERMTHAACRHVFGEEACRSLILLDVRKDEIDAALHDGTANMLQRLREQEKSAGGHLGDAVGTY